MLSTVKRRKVRDIVMIKCFWTATQTKELFDFCKIHNIPKVVEAFVINTIRILDDNYGVGRDMESDGGYVAILIQDDSEEIERMYDKLLQKYKINREWCEFSDELCSDGADTYQADLYITNTEFAVTVVWIQKERVER